GKRWGRLFVVGVVALITFVPFTTNLFIFIPWLTAHPDRNIHLWLLPFNLSVLSIWVNYYLGVTTDAGGVPAAHDPMEERDSKARGRRKPRWCKKCAGYKPPRAHHCSVCDRCILKMDHHCPWLNNCVGHNNQSHFVRFLLSVTTATISCLTLIGLRIWDLIQYQNQLARDFYHTTTRFFFYTPQPTSRELLFMIINLIILFLLLLTVGLLSLYQLYYVSTGVTTIESFERSRVEELVRRGKIAPERAAYPYDLGMWRNLDAVFGTPRWLWWVPRRAPGDGMRFEVADSAEGRVVADDWPPK
ncbi:DHHC palmitoyltransferase-domain-containing protein, partial [Blyttiomyces helicus]